MSLIRILNSVIILIDYKYIYFIMNPLIDILYIIFIAFIEYLLLHLYLKKFLL